MDASAVHTAWVHVAAVHSAAAEVGWVTMDVDLDGSTLLLVRQLDLTMFGSMSVGSHAKKPSVFISFVVAVSICLWAPRMNARHLFCLGD